MTTRALGPAISLYPPVGKIGLWYSCLRKLPYSKKEARNEVNSRNRRLRAHERDFVAYRCEHCGHYHVGHERTHR